MFPKAVNLAQRVTGDRAAAEDAALEALAKVHLRWNESERSPGETPGSKVAVNEAIRRLPRPWALPRLLVTSDPADEVVLRRP